MMLLRLPYLILSSLTLWGYASLAKAEVQDIGFMDTTTTNSIVLYEKDNRIYMRKCLAGTLPPLTRNCPTSVVQKYFEYDSYFRLLPFNIGAYSANDNGLALVTKAYEDARSAAANGNTEAQVAADRLEVIKANLETIISLKNDFKESQEGITYYEYQDYFIRLLTPFGEGGTMNFVSIKPGAFWMGAPTQETGAQADETLHYVILTKGFSIQTTEVTQEQWYRVMGSNPSYFSRTKDCPSQYKVINNIPMCPTHPVENMSWEDIQGFIETLNQQNDRFIYRLPTEAEWEYAVRAGTSGPYSVEGKLTDFMWYSENALGQTHPVGSKKPNRFGLYDVHGNVWEATSDFYEYHTSAQVTDPRGSVRSTYGYVIKGGSWYNSAKYARSAFRSTFEPQNHSGLRLVRTSRQ